MFVLFFINKYRDLVLVFCFSPSLSNQTPAKSGSIITGTNDVINEHYMAA